jgi:hypothetical protein
MNDFIKAYPNPTNGTVHFEMHSEHEYEVITLYNCIGEKIFELNVNDHIPDIIIDLDNYQIPKGIYFARFHSFDDQRSLLRKIVYK